MSRILTQDGRIVPGFCLQRFCITHRGVESATHSRPARSASGDRSRLARPVGRHRGFVPRHLVIHYCESDRFAVLDPARLSPPRGPDAAPTPPVATCEPTPPFPPKP